MKDTFFRRVIMKKLKYMAVFTLGAVILSFTGCSSEAKDLSNDVGRAWDDMKDDAKNTYRNDIAGDYYGTDGTYYGTGTNGDYYGSTDNLGRDDGTNYTGVNGVGNYLTTQTPMPYASANPLNIAPYAD